MMSELEENVENGQAAPPPAAEEPKPPAVPGEPAAAPPSKRRFWSFGDDKDEKPTGLAGNPLHPVRGGLITLAGALTSFAVMALEAQFRWGVPIGILGVCVATVGVLDFMGTFDDPEERVAARVTLADIQTPLIASVATLALTLVFIDLACAGRLPILASAILIPAAFIGCIVAVFRTGVLLGPWAKDETGEARSLLKREGFWVVVTGVLLYLPMQGSFSLSDPWETHYGEVAREMLARNDWISTWWAQDGWFWSKPVLDFWVQAIAMGVFGVNYRPGQMLVGEAGRTPWPEWAIRMPTFVLTIGALYILYKAVAKVFGRRTGMIGAIILATMPQWFLLAHQSITDMPLVASLSMSMGLLILGMHTDEGQLVKAYEISIGKKKIRFTGFHLVFGIILASALPQILYLVSRNVELQWFPKQPGFRWHLDEYFSGSKGNCGLPGNEICNPQKPLNGEFQPIKQGVFWGGLLALGLYLNWGERRLQRLFYLAAWYFAAVATLGKGIVGFGLPILVTFAYIAATRKWSKIVTLEIPTGLLVIGAVAIPWYLAMYVRHGQPFTDQLIFHHMYKRALSHVHDTNEGDDVSFRFFIWQLGYALFPWTGIVPAGLVWWTRRRDTAGSGQGDVSVFLAMWFVFAFALFSAMPTKFHHYIFPALPPAAMLAGIVIDRMLGRGNLAKEGSAQIGSLRLGPISALAGYIVGLGVASLALVYGFIRMFPGWVNGSGPVQGAPIRPSSPAIAGVLAALGVAIALFTIRTFGRAADESSSETPEDARTRRHEQLMLGAMAVASAIMVALCARDLSAKAEMSDVPGQARLIHLFTYNYRRPWPDTLEWSGLFAGFGVAFTVLSLFLMVARMRRHVVVMLMAASLLWAAWGLDVYLVKAAPHWGQREVIDAYYKMRGRPEEPIVAYQMNWKGENFYTGNQIPAFVSSGAPFSTYLQAQKDKGIKTFWFVTEHSRTNSLKSETGNPKTFDIVTDKRLNNKFCLVKAIFE